MHQRGEDIMQNTRRKYDSQFKRDAVALLEKKDRSAIEIAENLGISADLLYSWRRQLQRKGGIAFSGNGNKAMTDQEKRIRELEKKLKDTEMERDILKKAMAIFSKNAK